jgi:hypothetical protein
MAKFYADSYNRLYKGDRMDKIKILEDAIGFLNDYMELLNALERHATEDDVYATLQDLKELKETECK